MQLVKPGPGRPRKYGRPSRAVTVTLPEDVLARLGSMDPDLGRAIVRLVEGARPQRARVPRPVEIAHYGGRAVIVVTPSAALRRLPGVQLVPIADGRALIALDRPHSVPQLELLIRDLLDRNDVGRADRAMLEAIADILSGARRARGVVLEERTIIVLKPRASARSSR